MAAAAADVSPGGDGVSAEQEVEEEGEDATDRERRKVGVLEHVGVEGGDGLVTLG